MNDDEEKSLETRSLPGTPPPLAVKIPQPTLSGPSSDPGRAPSPTSSKIQAPSMDREMNEMNRRLLNTRRVWEVSSWSETQGTDSQLVASSSSIGGVATIKDVEKKAAPMREISNEPSSPSKASAEITPTTSSTNVDSSKAGDEKPVTTGFNNISKRPEQQVCKVKPQQQQPVALTQQASADSDVIRLPQAKSSTDRSNLGIGSQSPLSEFMLQRQLYASSTGDNSAYATESFRSQPTNQFASLSSGQVSHSTTALSQHALSSLHVGNIYGSPMTWQMMPTSSSMQQQSQGQQQGSTLQQQQQAKTHITYPTAPNHASLFTSSSLGGAAGNTSMIMQYDSTFDQRNNTNIQRQPISIVPIPQQQQQQSPHLNQQQATGPIGMLPNSATGGRPAMRRDQLYRSVPSEQLAAMLLNQSNTAGLPLHQQHLIAQQQAQQNTDLTKHVNAKPFEPTTQGSAPPLIANTPIMQQSMQHMQQQQMVSTTVFRPNSAHSNHLGTVGPPRQHHVQATHNQQQRLQSLIQANQQQRQNIQATQQQHAPLVANVMPRQAQPMNLAAAKQQSADRSPNFQQQQQHYSKANTSHHHHPNMNPPSMNALNARRQQHMNHAQQIPMSNQSIPNHFNVQQQQQQRSHQQRVATAAGMNFPSPIQRPSPIATSVLQQQQQHGNYSTLQQQQQQPLSHQSLPPQQQQPPVTDFKKIQRQKMLADTKKYFQQQQEKHAPSPSISSTTTDQEKPDEKPLNNGTPPVIKDLHPETTDNKQIPPIQQQQPNNLKTQGPTVGDSASVAAAQNRATPSGPVPSKV